MKRTFLILVLLAVSGMTMAAQEPAPKEKETYLNKVDKEVQDWTTKIKSLEDRSEKSGVKTREDMDRRIQTVKDDLQAARKKADELRTSSANAWESLQKGLERTLSDVKRHYQKAVSATPAATKK